MTVDARMYAVVTHCIWSTPPRSPTMVGSAVAVTVSDSVLTNMASSNPANTAATPRECSGLGSLAGTPPCRADAAASSRARVRAAASRAASDVAEAKTWPERAAVEGASKAAARLASSTIEVSGVVSGSSLSCTRAASAGASAVRSMPSMPAPYRCVILSSMVAVARTSMRPQHTETERSAERRALVGKPANARTKPPSRMMA